MKYVPAHVRDDIIRYKKDGHTLCEMFTLLKERYPRINKKLIRKVIENHEKTYNIPIGHRTVARLEINSNAQRS